LTLLLSPSHNVLTFACYQFESQKNAVEIELKESLRRREEDLQTKLEALGDPADDGITTSDDLESRTRELRALNASIDSLTRRVKGQHISFVLPLF
jgi:structural maintenance of chromosome 3 (chondroitin sulfate proteoglycan 6)